MLIIYIKDKEIISIMLYNWMVELIRDINFYLLLWFMF